MADDTRAVEVVDDACIENLDDHPPLHRRVLEKAAELAEPAIRLLPPFDRLLRTKLASRTLHAMLVGLPPDERERFRQDMVANAKFSMCGEAFRDQPAFDRLRPLKKRDSDRRIREFKPKPPRDPHFDSKPAIIATCRARCPAFEHDPHLLMRLRAALYPIGAKGGQYFCRPLVGTTRLVIMVAAEPLHGSMLDVAIGITEPLFAIRCGAPWATSGHWPFWDEASCVQAVNDAMDIVDIVLPPFAEKMAEALSGAV